MLVFLLTAPLLTFPVCLAFSAEATAVDQFTRPWFAGLGSGVLLAAVEMIIRMVVPVRLSSPMLFLQLSARETTVPVAIAVGLFFAFCRRFRGEDPELLELGLAAFLSGALTTRAIYHALYVADAATIYWSFLAPTLAVAAVFIVPFLFRQMRLQFGWGRVALIVATVAGLFVLSGVPLLYSLRYHVLSICAAALLAIGGASLWVFRRLSLGSLRAS